MPILPRSLLLLPLLAACAAPPALPPARPDITLTPADIPPGPSGQAIAAPGLPAAKLDFDQRPPVPVFQPPYLATAQPISRPPPDSPTQCHPNSSGGIVCF